MNQNKKLLEYWNKGAKKIPLDKDPSRYAIEKERQFPKSALVCDLGGGVGADATYFLEKGHTVILLDVSPFALSQAKKRALKRGFYLETIQSDLSSGYLPLEDSCVDIIYARLSLHYFTKLITEKIFLEIYRTLKTPGKAFITLKSPNDPEEMEFLEKTAIRSDEGIFLDDGLMKSRFSQQQLQEILSVLPPNRFKVSAYTEDLKNRVDAVKSGKSEFHLNEIIIYK